MSFIESLPTPEWREHIAAYWVRKTEPDANAEGRRVYADGCVDLICNTGETTAYYYPKAQDEYAIPIHPGRLYLGGTMTAYGVVTTEPGAILTGIRFWPGGFYAVFKQDMQPAVDTLIDFPDDELRTRMQHDNDKDHWLSHKAPTPTDFKTLRKLMYESGGQTTIEALAQSIHVSNRTLERIFKKNVGILPSELSLFYKTGIAGDQYF